MALAAAVGASASGCSGAESGQDGSSADRVTVVGTGAGGSPVPTASNPQSSLAPAATGSAGSPSATPDSAGSRVPVCAEIATWGTSLQESAPYTGAELYGVRSGRHDCYDRVVFDINGADTVGYHVRYVDSVHADGRVNRSPSQGMPRLRLSSTPRTSRPPRPATSPGATRGRSARRCLIPVAGGPWTQ